ncbi:hypothetical protein PUR71_37120 [Streptomyces sp. SP17BM10]|uniref:hypothetical protein n=1 Tax=Streptomyces sp. SP17BM10 TaxID=3002530 RepID=UPI002E79672A|nr:hypothetical protein [Streptomyces sp. SP17BM10]MEE1788482.1 hypothetical protein [Streptomyces sp. SP17BM10]
MSVGEDKHGTGEQGSAGFHLPVVNWAMAAEGDGQDETVEVDPSASGPSSAGGGAVPEVPARHVPPKPPGVGPEAVLETGADPDTETAAATAEALAEAAVADREGATAAADGPRPGRVSRPMVAAAVAVGLVLVGASVVVTQLGGGDPKHGPAQADNPPGYGQGGGDGGSGYVPGTDGGNGGNGNGGNGAAPGDPGAAGGTAPGVALPVGDPAAGAPTTDAVQPGAPGQPAGAPAAGAPGAGGVLSPRQAGAVGQGGGNPATTAGGSTGSGSGGSGGNAPQQPGPGAPAPQQPAPQQPAPQQPAPQQPAPPPAKPADPPPVVTVLGPGCSGKGAYRENGRFSKGIEGWIGNSGGWGGDGCNGSYTSVPMYGDASKDDPTASVVWTFTVGNVRTCALSVYVPASGDVTKVGGHPTYYTVQSGGSGRSFNVDQISRQGSWVDVGSFSYSGSLAVTLHTRGVDWGSGASHAHHAASAIRATCTS